MSYSKDVRQALQIQPGEWFFLQPTRVVPRKGIEHAIELTRRLGKKAHLIVSHASGDEGDAYEQYLVEYARLLKAPVSFVSDIIRERRGNVDGRKTYTLHDIYSQADIVTYPSETEGFGNAFLEAVYYKRPIVVNNYSIFNTDIKPKGFRVIEFDGNISDKTIDLTKQVLNDPDLAHEMVEYNYLLAKRYYSLSRPGTQTTHTDCRMLRGGLMDGV